MRNTASLICLVIGFFTGVGCYFFGAQVVLNMEARKIAALTDSYYESKKACAAEKLELTQPRRKNGRLGSLENRGRDQAIAEAKVLTVD